MRATGSTRPRDGRHLTLGALEPKFFARACELIGRPDLAERQFGDAQDDLAAELEAAFATRPLAEWLELFDGEDACVGPVATRAEAAAEFGPPASGHEDAALGAHTAAWRAEVGAGASFGWEPERGGSAPRSAIRSGSPG